MSHHERREEEARVRVSVTVNGTQHVLSLDPRSSLLDVLREQLALTGAKRVATMGSVAPAPCILTVAASCPV
jgi:xanthine dehydrogenase YagT iron-sulfur-binding subunit